MSKASREIIDNPDPNAWVTFKTRGGKSVSCPTGRIGEFVPAWSSKDDARLQKSMAELHEKLYQRDRTRLEKLKQAEEKKRAELIKAGHMAEVDIYKPMKTVRPDQVAPVVASGVQEDHTARYVVALIVLIPLSIFLVSAFLRM